MLSRSLKGRLWNQIEPMWCVDFHSHIPIGQESAGSMARLLCYHYSETDAMNAGMPYDEYTGREDWAEKARFLIPYFPSSIGTTTYAGLHEVARGLFGFEDRIGPDTWDALCEKADEKMAEEGWTEHALRASRIVRAFGTNDPFEDLMGARPWYQVCLRVDKFINVDEQPLSDTIRDLSEATGRGISDLSDFLDAMDVRFGWFREQGAASVAISLPPDFSLNPGATSAEAAFDRVLTGVQLSSAELFALKTRLFYGVLDLCRKYGFVFQLMLGVVRKVHRGVGVCGDGLRQDPGTFQAFWEPMNSYPDVRFDFTALSAADQHQLCIMVKNFSNAVVSGFWWYCNTPSIIEAGLRMRLELLGAHCQNGQNTDAYMVEQGYYKMRQYKRTLCRTLAAMVEDELFDEGEAIEVAGRLLMDNPIRHFGLDREKIEAQIQGT